LVDRNLGGLWATPEDQRVRAMVLALRPGDRRESIKTLVASFERVKPTPVEEFLLAQLYEADRKWPKASEILRELALSKQGVTAEMLAFYVRALIRHNQVSDAQIWLEKLESMEPNDPRTIELKARVLKEQKKGEVAGQLVGEFARKYSAAKHDWQTVSRLAMLLSDLGEAGAAEQLFRFNADQNEKTHAETSLALASFLASHGKLPEALDICQRVATNGGPDIVAAVMVGALRLGQANDADRNRVRTLLEEMLRKKPNSVSLLVARADLLDACADYDGAERVYRDLLERDPRNVLALNNLAWLLAVHGNKGEEANQLIERAIELAGPGSDLLDTQASVLIVLGKAEEAVKKLEDAVQQSPTGSHYFHLTQAFEKAGRHDHAKENWIKATKDMLLNEKALHPLERADFEKFSTEMTAGNG
jgi:Flp pilus assembly protein TadD